MVTMSPPRSEDGVLADLPLGEVHQEDFALVHDAPDVDRPLGVREDPVERRVGEEGADLVLDRGDPVGAHPVGVFFILLFPKRPHLGVVDVPERLLPDSAYPREA